MRNNGKREFREKCLRAGIDIKRAVQFRRKHIELTDEQVILYYNPYCYFNIQGEFIIVPIPDKRE